jgi:hypothetical protein
MESLMAAKEEEVSVADADANAVDESERLRNQVASLKDMLQAERAQHAATRREALQALTVLGYTGAVGLATDEGQTTRATEAAIPEAVPPQAAPVSDALPASPLLLSSFGRRRAPVGTATRLRVLAARVAETEEALVAGSYIATDNSGLWVRATHIERTDESNSSEAQMHPVGPPSPSITAEFVTG